MTRAEFKVALWKIRFDVKEHFERNVRVAKCFWPTSQKQWDEYAAHNATACWYPDPLEDIAAAWALLEWLKSNDMGSFTCFECEWESVNASSFVCNLTAPEAALWICQAVYFAVTGERVELEEL